jgi:hypothetical protein
MPLQLPVRASYEHLKKVTKERLVLLRRKNPGAKLADAQLPLARTRVTTTTMQAPLISQLRRELSSPCGCCWMPEATLKARGPGLGHAKKERGSCPDAGRERRSAHHLLRPGQAARRRAGSPDPTEGGSPRLRCGRADSRMGTPPFHAAFAPPNGSGFLMGAADYGMLEVLIGLRQ